MNFIKHLGRFLWRFILVPTFLIASIPVVIPMLGLLGLLVATSEAWEASKR